MFTIPAQLDWLPIANDLTSFVAFVSDNEYLSIVFDSEMPVGYQWKLFIVRNFGAHGDQSVFLHGHSDLQEAKAAARTHLGID